MPPNAVQTAINMILVRNTLIKLTSLLWLFSKEKAKDIDLYSILKEVKEAHVEIFP